MKVCVTFFILWNTKREILNKWFILRIYKMIVNREGYVKGIVHQKMKTMLYHFLILMLLLTCMDFFLLMNTQDILINDGKNTAECNH